MDEDNEPEFPGNIKYSYLFNDLVGNIEVRGKFFIFKATPKDLYIPLFDKTITVYMNTNIGEGIPLN
jgi:hypothetical protein